MNKLLPLIILLAACEYQPQGISDSEFDELLNNCDTPNISLEILTDEQLIIYGRHQQMCEENNHV